ncbi:hypothetical protein HYH03_007069 [Edaphochlamys debaryana]|uniref:Ankyrin repeat domain-containing protein n=1 Tax=Edaphochlamys debaryana TaxID=47281 RepID=A0A835Y4Z4_9CHLO|nr:hypothetical protein HYH03_007069 [Edaphochlamys debaryana]|eukprot:KAG2494828.1 hypothetical protein HYH03_007069 [Edaphochlamys debaryana]
MPERAALAGHPALALWLLERDPGPEWARAVPGLVVPTAQTVASTCVAALEGCDLATVQRLCAELGAPPASWTGTAKTGCLAWALSSRTPDWRAKAEWLVSQVPGWQLPTAPPWTLSTLYPQLAGRLRGAELLERFAWLKAKGRPPLPGDLYALQQAVRSGDVTAFEWLLAEGVLLPPTGEAPSRLLAEEAAQGGHVGVLQALRREGARLEAGKVAETAAWEGHLPVLEWLWSAFEWTREQNGLTPAVFAAAAEAGSVECMRWLSLHGCGMGEAAWTAIVESGCEAAVEALVELGCPQPFDPKCPEDGEEVWGKDILAAYDELFPKEGDEEEEEEEFSSRPKMGCLDCNRWAGAIEMIADQILWDRDFEMCDIFRNGHNSRLMAHARVEPDYFEPFEGRAKPGAEDRLYDLVYSIIIIDFGRMKAGGGGHVRLIGAQGHRRSSRAAALASHRPQPSDRALARVLACPGILDAGCDAAAAAVATAASPPCGTAEAAQGWAGYALRRLSLPPH